MVKIAVIEDDPLTSDQLCGWIRRAVPTARVDQWFSRDDAMTAVAREVYDLITLDIEMGAERNAGVRIIKEATRNRPVPVLVVSGMPADLYRGVMKALDAWDYLQKPVGEHDLIETLLDILRTSQRPVESGAGTLHLDPLRQAKPTWQGQRLNLSNTQQRLLNAIYTQREAADPTVPYPVLYDAVLSGKNRDNIKKQVSQIKAAFRDIDPQFNAIVVEPMRGYRWVQR